MIAPIPATAHVAWADLGLVLDDTHCDACGLGLTFDTEGNQWCAVCDADWAVALEEQYADSWR